MVYIVAESPTWRLVPLPHQRFQSTNGNKRRPETKILTWHACKENAVVDGCGRLGARFIFVSKAACMTSTISYMGLDG